VAVWKTVQESAQILLASLTVRHSGRSAVVEEGGIIQLVVDVPVLFVLDLFDEPADDRLASLGLACLRLHLAPPGQLAAVDRQTTSAVSRAI
jgi:hypothetical protein